MRSTFTTICICLTLVVSGQRFSFSTTDTVITSENPNATEIYALIDVVNHAGSDLAMKWRLVSDSMPSGWEFSICDPVNCHPAGIDSSDFTLTPTSNNHIVNCHFYPEGVEGEGKVQFEVFELGKEDSAVTITYYASVFEPEDTTNTDTVTTSLSKLPDDEAVIIYDPSLKKINVRTATTSPFYEVKVYDITGNTLRRSKDRTIHLSGLPEGLYVIRLENKSGHALKTTKIMVY